MEFKAIALAAAVALSSAGAQAVVVVPDVPPTFSFSDTVAGAFLDTWEFNLPAASTVTAGVLNVSFTVAGNSTGAITDFWAKLDGVTLLGAASTQLLAPGLTLTTTTKAGLFNLNSGVHTLTVGGAGVTGGFATYTGYIQAVPVPEPETYAMLAAGLGIVGFVASRRRRND